MKIYLWDGRQTTLADEYWIGVSGQVSLFMCRIDMKTTAHLTDIPITEDLDSYNGKGRELIGKYFLDNGSSVVA